MTLIFMLLDNAPAPLWPSSLMGWLGLLLLLGVVLWALWFSRQYQPPWNGRALMVLIGLGILVVPTSLFLGVRFPPGSALPPPGVPTEPRGPALMVLCALPWMRAGGILGPVGAAALGFFAGLLRFLWDTQSVFTPLELALLAILFSAAVRQRYRTLVFRLLRQPVPTAIVLALFFVLLYVIDAFFDGRGTVAARLDYALTRAGPAFLTMGGELLVAGVFVQVLVIALPNLWGTGLPLLPSPAERSLESRFLFSAGLLIILLLIFLLVGDWVVAGNAARQMLEDRLLGAAQNAAETVPFFLETGQNLAMQVASDPELLAASPDQLPDLLARHLRVVPYFDQYVVFGPNESMLGSYPTGSAVSTSLFPEESAGVELAFSGVLTQIYSIPPAETGQPARVSFVIAMIGADQHVERVLIGRTDLLTNPFTQPMVKSLSSITELGGAGILLDENGRILYHPIFTQVMNVYLGQRPVEAAFFDDTAPDGTRSLVYYQPVVGRSWAVVMTVPAQRAQQLVLIIAAPLSILIMVLAFVALVSLRLGLRVVTTSLQNLSNEVAHIAQGQLDRPLLVEGVDEVGQLGRAFEQMRVSLWARLDELNRLLVVSQGIASSLQVRDAVQPVLEAALGIGADAARIVLSPSASLEQQKVLRLGLGPLAERYASFDEQILTRTQGQGRLVLSQINRSRTLDIPSDRPAPSSLLAVPLLHENRYYGVLWVGYDQSHSFSDGDVRYISTLAGQAALAAANAHLFLTAEVGRQRLAAILDSTPDPVLVTDYQNRLLLANPAAWQILGTAVGTGEGEPIEKVIGQKALIDILSAASVDKQSAEVAVSTGQTYLATASPVVAEGQLVGRVCILRDVTHFKELDMMKSEFVNTVSHDLRSPLTLMRGYATMLELAGTLNEQQHSYVHKMISGVDSMSRLVNTLLDLGRIEVGVGLQLETTPLLDILEHVVNPLQQQAGQKNIALNMEVPKGKSPLIQADAALLQQAMYNLVENAIKYTPPGGKVTVRLKTQGDMMLLEVQDTGIGIPATDQTRLFEKFYRGSQREARREKGSGLGLAIVKSIVERHGGKVWLESRVGKGSTFFLELPLRQTREPK
jgi:two-component system phosphate regulon sensor histidine kinase PhoR